MGSLHLIKLCVGCDTVDELLAWSRSHFGDEAWTVNTRQTPKRAEELLQGGSLYRVYKGMILSRQRILGVETLGQGGQARCEIIIDPQVVLTAPTPRRAFQGWRYLHDADAPPDIGPAGSEGPMPPDLARQLRELGAW